MTTKLTFYTNPMSRGRTARWMLEEIGVEYETKVLDYGTTMKSEEYLAINPMGKVPAIVHGEQIVTECAAICSYLAEAFPEAGLAPAESERADYFRWLFFAAGPVEAALANKALSVEVPTKMEATIGYGSYAAVLDTLSFAVGRHPYIAGDRFTAADVYVGSMIGFGLLFGTIEKRPEYEEYWARISSRPACQRAADLDNALMPEKGNVV